MIEFLGVVSCHKIYSFFFNMYIGCDIRITPYSLIVVRLELTEKKANDNDAFQR
jgi:hypothetical protein